jgi:hypothetical protein
VRAREILSELKLDIPDQMVNVQIPLANITKTSDADPQPVINPGKRPGEDGNYKWSPPLQQHLDTSKDAVGISNDETNHIAAEVEAEKELSKDQEIEDLKAKLAHLLAQNAELQNQPTVNP